MDYEVLVVGAGPAGSTLARRLALAGRRVALCDANPADRLGKSVIVELEIGACKAAGVEPPGRDEIPYHARSFRVFTPSGQEAFVASGGIPTTAIYLDRFVRRLQDRAVDAGATFLGGWRARRPLHANGRVVGASFSTDGGEHELRATLVVDATGFDGTLVHKLELEPDPGAPDDHRDVVLAGTRLVGVDPQMAADAVRRGVQGDREIWTWVGRLGNYSTEFRHLNLERSEGYLLVGLKADEPRARFDAAIRDGLAPLGPVGETLHGANGSIRIGHTRHRIAWDGFAVLGEAARMVVPATGSGVASGMLSAAASAPVIERALEAGEVTTASLWPLAARWHRGRGALQAGLDAVRIAYDELPSRTAEAFLGGGFTGPDDLVATTLCALPSTTPRSFARRGLAIARRPGLIPPMSRMGAIGAAIVLHHRRYPRRWDPSRFARWSRRSDRLFSQLRSPGSS
jgi:flavin-dependent dehydrogenase